MHLVTDSLQINFISSISSETSKLKKMAINLIIDITYTPQQHQL